VPACIVQAEICSRSWIAFFRLKNIRIPNDFRRAFRVMKREILINLAECDEAIAYMLEGTAADGDDSDLE